MMVMVFLSLLEGTDTTNLFIFYFLKSDSDFPQT